MKERHLLTHISTLCHDVVAVDVSGRLNLCGPLTVMNVLKMGATPEAMELYNILRELDMGQHLKFWGSCAKLIAELVRDGGGEDLALYKEMMELQSE